MVQVPVYCGEWVMRDSKWNFVVDNRKGGRMLFFSDDCTHRELIAMVQDDFNLDKNTELVLTYSLPDSMLKQMDTDSPTPPMCVSNDRQVRSLVELCKGHLIRLCVSSGVGMSSGKNDDVDAEVAEEAEEDGNGDEDNEDDGAGGDEHAPYFEHAKYFEEEEMDISSDGGEGASNVRNDEYSVKENHAYEIDNEFLEDYSVYGKVKDEDVSENEDDGAKGIFVGEGQRMNTEWSDGLFVKASFPTKDALISEVRKTAIMAKFSFKVHKSSKTLFVATCSVDGCKWRVRGGVKYEPNTFWVTLYEPQHTCSATDRIALRKHQAPKYIGELFYDEWGTIDGVTPEMIRSAMKKKFGMKMNYTTSYRAFIYAQLLVRGTPEDGYANLPSYLYRVQQANPGTVTDLVVDDQNRFKYMFFALGASIAGFQYVRRVMVVDGCHLPGKYGGVLLVACGQDANFQIFPLAFAIVDAEDDESWRWFFTKLSGCVSDQYPLAIVSDRHVSIKNAIETVMPWATRGICYYHLQDNIVTNFKGRHLLYLVKSAAYAYTHHDFDRYMDAIRGANPALATYLEEAGFNLWARVHFPGHRYNVQTSNIAESINSLLKPARGFPIPLLLEYIREKLGRWFYRRREDAMKLTTKHSKGVEYLLTVRQYYADKMTVERIDSWRFYVKGGHRDCIVDFLHRKCQCGVYDVEMIPCSHAIAAAPELMMDVAALVCPSYTKDYYYATYASNIFPQMRDIKEPKFVEVLPPEVRRKPGRQKKSRWLKWFEIAKKFKDKPRKPHKKYSCSQCKQYGHTRPNCKK